MNMRQAYKNAIRHWRVVHSTNIMEENAFLHRMDATSVVRAFTQRWDIPAVKWESIVMSPHNYRKMAYKPTLAFRVFMQRETAR